MHLYCVRTSNSFRELAAFESSFVKSENRAGPKTEHWVYTRVVYTARVYESHPYALTLTECLHPVR